ncbi:AMP-binding protein [Streptomyces sp. NPDC059909]|uniref:AMP-binding protein n=1 Tax=Streptomyces sp. NPDC059909 TaxID=3346998 RepID=UPI0036537401
MLNLAVMLETSARAVPGRTAVVLGDQQLTYAELDAAARRVANLLRSRGIEPGDKVALSCPNLPWFPIVYYGILKAGAVVARLVEFFDVLPTNATGKILKRELRDAPETMDASDGAGAAGPLATSARQV